MNNNEKQEYLFANKVNKKTKKTKKRKLKIVTNAQDLKVKEEPKIMPSDKERKNEIFIKLMEELGDYMNKQGEPFRAKAYRGAAEAIMKITDDIYSEKELEKTPKIGKTIISKLKEYMETGKIEALERERKNPMNILTKVYGIGPKKAKELISSGITTIEQLKQNQSTLTDNMKIGLKYFDDIEEPIKREEIIEYQKELLKIFNKSDSKGSNFEIVGSFRRGAKTSGDIDIIISNQDNDREIFTRFIKKLKDAGIIIEILSKGDIKSLTIARLPGKPARRVDFMYSPPDEYAFAILYFTGSKIFNTLQRQRALDLGFSLNEHGLYKMTSGKKGKKIEEYFPNEEAIFQFLKMQYRNPEDRINSTSVVYTDTPKSPKKKDTEKKATEKGGTAKKAPTQKLTIKKRLTIKKPKKSDNIGGFKKEGVSYLKTLTENELSEMIRMANQEYYCSNKSLLTDNEYDILREYTIDKYPDNKAAEEGHTKCEIVKNKAVLPYEMWSMDKIKPDTNALSKYKKDYGGPYVFSCKLDGVSGLYSTESKEPKLYTRGNGKIGQDVSHMIPYLNLPKEKGIVIRGEFIIKKTLFQNKYANEFANARNFVAGLVNQKKVESDKLQDLDFVVYELIQPEMKPSNQYDFLKKHNVQLVKYETSKTVSNEMLSELLLSWRKDYEYEIDGIICVNDAIYPRPKSNPPHAFAFKMVLSDQVAETKVHNVLWTASKDGYLKPRVQLEPVTLGGAKIEFATGFNGKFIEDNKIGVGALITLVRSGDVIPHIISVVEPADKAQMPDVEYEWNKTHVDIMLKDKQENITVREKLIAGFFKAIEVEGLGEGNIRRLMQAGYDSTAKIINMKEEDYLNAEGFKKKLANKIYTSIKNKIKEVSLPELMHATNIFGRGLATKKLTLILNDYPDILMSTSKDAKDNIDKLLKISGMGEKTAEQFVKKIPEFNKWISEAQLEYKTNYKKAKLVGDKNHELYGKKIVTTGVGGKDRNRLSLLLRPVGGILETTVNKDTFITLVLDLNEDTEKAKKAKQLNIPIMILDKFITKYNL